MVYCSGKKIHIIALFCLLIWNVHQNIGNMHMDFCHTLYICYQFIKGYLTWLYAISICRYLIKSFQQKILQYNINCTKIKWKKWATKFYIIHVYAVLNNWGRNVVRIWVWEGEIFLGSVHLSKSTPISIQFNSICRYFMNFYLQKCYIIQYLMHWNKM